MGVDEHTIEIGGQPVFYRSSGAEGQPARTLYLHGVPTCSDDWTPFLARTGGLAPDLPGFGRSGKGGHLDYTLEGYADFVERFLEHVGLARVNLVAHDWGAAAGLVAAQRRPGLVERLVLIDAVPLLPGFRWHFGGRVLRVPMLGELAMGSTNKALLGRTLRRAAATPGAWPDARLAAVWERFDQGTQRAILRIHRDASPERLAEAGARLSDLGGPILVLWGDRDSWLRPELADAYGARLPSATVQRIADAGHWPWLDRPEVIDRVAELLL